MPAMHVTFKVVRVASADNMVHAASRFVDREDYKLAPVVFQQLEQRWGPFDVDLFASAVKVLKCQNYLVPLDALAPRAGGCTDAVLEWHEVLRESAIFGGVHAAGCSESAAGRSRGGLGRAGVAWPGMASGAAATGG